MKRLLIVVLLLIACSAWAIPPSPPSSGSGDMAKATYDTNSNNVVDTATALAADPADCAAGSVATAINASGTLTCGKTIGTDIQAYDAELGILAGLTFTDASLIQLTAANSAAVLTSGGNDYFLKSATDNSALMFATPAEVRTALGLVIGTNVQAYDADLTYLAGFTPSDNVKTVLNAANNAAIKTALGYYTSGDNVTVGTVNAGGGGMTVDADGDVVVKSLTSTAATTTGGYLRLAEGSDNGTDYSSITGKADAGAYPAFTFGGSQGSEDLTLTAAADKWTIASTSGATVGITPATNIVGALSLGTAGATAASLVLNNATSGAVTISPITGALGAASLVIGTTFTNAKWCSYATATGLTCNETPGAGTGDVLADGSVPFTGDVTIQQATPDIILNDSDDAAGTASIKANSSGGANDIVLTVGVEDSSGAGTSYIEVDGVSETVDLLKPVVVTGDYLSRGADPADAGAIRLSNADKISWEADAAGTDVEGIAVDSSEVVQIGAAGASGVKITPSTSIGPAAPDDVRPTLSVIGDADSDAADTTEALTVTLTANADPTLATWGFTSTQSAGYTFDKPVQAPAKFVSFTAAATLTAAAHNGALVMMTTADEVTMWDCTASTIGHWVTLWARDAEKIEVVPATDDQFYTFAGTGIGANDELDMAATAGTKVTLMCTAASEWRVVYETAACADGGAAD